MYVVFLNMVFFLLFGPAYSGAARYTLITLILGKKALGDNILGFVFTAVI